MLIFFIGFEKNSFLRDESNDLISPDFKISDIEDIDETLSKQSYYSYDKVGKRYISIIVYKDETASMKHYLVENYGEVDITIPRGHKFIISLGASRTVAYTWNIKNDIEKGVIQFKGASWMEVPLPEALRGNIGVSNDRQNFFFKPIKKGRQKVILRYEHNSEKRSEYFEVTLNVRIKK